ncbi:MAG TPA: potassium transporter Kup [Nitrospiraceae bacterium]|nr:potassium transporter Kup [Nitrospiraceae bacterium]
MAADISRHTRLSTLALAALGVVYGDIGTSPLYALRECFHPSHSLAVTDAHVLGVLSLIIWSLLLVVTVKYLVFVLRADNEGEGGILALMALSQRHKGHIPSRRLEVVVVLGLLGAALVYGDGIITPAISVLSAVEGLEMATPLFKPYLIVIAVVVLVVLFIFQGRGTGRIGRIFGPVILVWFVTLAVLGLVSIVQTPGVLLSGNPVFALSFLLKNPGQAFGVLGSVFLVLTGAEALYVDMGHFGKAPIRAGWFAVVLPALLLQYLGQGALLIRSPEAVANPFYLLAPDWLLYPLVGLATAATVIASQAMLSGAFSLTHQAIQLGYLPRMTITHTSAAQIGQIYVPFLNWAMLVGTISLVLFFQTSSNLAAAYGIAVSGTMVITSILTSVVSRRIWRWGWPATLAMSGTFLLVDVTFFSANALKIPQGGWLPLALGALFFLLMTTWHRGRALVNQHIRSITPPLVDFLGDAALHAKAKVPGYAVFMTHDPDTTPPALQQNVRHNQCLHEHVIFLTVMTQRVPYVPCDRQVNVIQLDAGVHRVIVQHGFLDMPDIPGILKECQKKDLTVPVPAVTFFLSRLIFLATPKPGMALWREKLFVFLARNSTRASSFFRIPSEQVIEIGLVVEI